MRKTWWHYSHSRLSVSYIALYALTTVYIWTPGKCIIESYFLFQHIYLIELLYLLDSPGWDSWLWVSCDHPGSRLCPDCGSSAGHPARPWPLVTVTSLEKAKCPQIFTDRASGIKWVSLNHYCPSSIHCFHPTNNVSLPPTWQEYYWAINSNNNWSDQKNQ